MAELLTPDLCVIGAGSGGLTVTAAARAFGASVVLVERGAMGGDCLNTGCVPSKTLIASARRAHAMATASRFGIANSVPKIGHRAVHDVIHAVIDEIAPQDSALRYTALGARVIAGEASFVDPRTISVGESRVRARRFVIATGSAPRVPPVPGLAEVPYFTNETIFANTRKLSHLVIIGAGSIGIELAQAYRRLGSEVTVIETGSPLAASDPELSEIALRRLAGEGISIRAGTSVTRIEKRSLGIGVTIATQDQEDCLDASHILVATGRRANLDALKLDNAKIRRDSEGKLIVSRGLKTTNGRVYAIGDAAGGLQFTHAAGYHAGLVVRNALFGLPVRNSPHLVPRATYCDPEIAEVGLSEALARRRRGTRYKVVRVAYAENDRARTERETYGLAKMITDPRGTILGAGIVGAGAGEMIALFSFAIANRLAAKNLLAFVAPYPTLSAIAKRLGTEYYRDQTGNPWLARLMAFNRLLP